MSGQWGLGLIISSNKSNMTKEAKKAVEEIRDAFDKQKATLHAGDFLALLMAIAEDIEKEIDEYD